MSTQFSRRRQIRFVAAVVIGLAFSGTAWHLWLDRGSASRAVVADQQGRSDVPPESQRAGLCSPVNTAGVGLRGDYFLAAGLVGAPTFTRIDTTIDFAGTVPWPTERLSGPPRSVRWQGWIRPPLSGRYRFHAEPSVARVVVSRQVVAGPDAADDTSIELTLGRFYPILVEVPLLATDSPNVRLEWTAPHGARYVVPRASLYLPTETVGQTVR